MAAPLVTIIETPWFQEDAEGIMTAAELSDLTFFLAGHPEFGDVIPETGGVRKIRWAVKGKGKSGGARVIYYFYDIENPLVLLGAYSKNQKKNLSQKEKQNLKKVAGDIKAEFQKRRRIQ